MLSLAGQLALLFQNILHDRILHGLFRENHSLGSEARQGIIVDKSTRSRQSRHKSTERSWVPVIFLAYAFSGILLLGNCPGGTTVRPVPSVGGSASRIKRRNPIFG